MWRGCMIMKIKNAIARLNIDTYGKNVGGEVFATLASYYRVSILSNNEKFDSIVTNRVSFKEVTSIENLMMINPNSNFYGGIPNKHVADVVRLINIAKNVVVYITDPLLSPKQVTKNKVPGLIEAMDRLVNCKTITHGDTDFIPYYIANHKVVCINKIDKQYDAVYYGNKRGNSRQKQVEAYLSKVDKPFIIGYEHEKYPSVEYAKNFLHQVNKAWITPVIGDKKHYENNALPLRFYEPWFTTTIGLVDKQFNVDIEDCFITSPATIVDDIERVKRSHKKLVNLQRLKLNSLITKHKNKYGKFEILFSK